MYSHGQRDGPDARLGWPRGGDSASPRTLWPCRGEHWTTWWAGWPDSLQGSPLTPGSSSCASHLRARPWAPVPCRGQEASPCGSSKRLLGGRQRADARGWGHPAGRSSVLWGGRASGVCLHPAQPASAGGGAQGWSLTDSWAPAPQAATYVPITGRGGGGSQLRPPPMAALCFQCLLPKATWAWVPEGGGRAGGGGAGVQLQRRDGRGGHTQTHGCPCPGAEGGTLTTPGLGAASASWPVLPPGRPPKVREAWLRGRTRRSSAREHGASWHRDGRGGPGCGARTPPAHPAAFRALVRAPARAQPLPDLGSGVAGARLVARASRGLACSASGGTGKEVQRCAPEPG